MFWFRLNNIYHFCFYRLFYVYIPMRAAERYRRRVSYAFSAHCATVGVEFCLELLVRRFDAAHDAHPEELDDSRLSAHVARVAPKRQRDIDPQKKVSAGDVSPQEEPLVASFLVGLLHLILQTLTLKLGTFY